MYLVKYQAIMLWDDKPGNVRWFEKDEDRFNTLEEAIRASNKWFKQNKSNGWKCRYKIYKEELKLVKEKYE